VDETGSSGVDPGAEPPVEGGVEPHETGGEVVLEEAREELVRLVTHPVSELKRLEHVAEEGDSAATPLIVAVGLMLVIGLVLALALAVILLVYYGT
jgi:hypothetical protein